MNSPQTHDKVCRWDTDHNIKDNTDQVKEEGWPINGWHSRKA